LVASYYAVVILIFNKNYTLDFNKIIVSFWFYPTHCDSKHALGWFKRDRGAM
jgi:hypothetical protein